MTRADPLLEFCRGLPGVTEDVKWDNDLVFSEEAISDLIRESHHLVAQKLPKKLRTQLGLYE